MENVVRLAEYRKRKDQAQGLSRGTNTTPDWGPQYYCLRCDADEFKLYASGMVHCSHCGALMRNLLVNSSAVPEEEEEAQ